MTPKYKSDILHQLRHVDGAAAALGQARECLNDLSATLTRAADEIERLRLIRDAARALIEYECEGEPDFPDWDAKFDALKAALQGGAK